MTSASTDATSRTSSGGYIVSGQTLIILSGDTVENATVVGGGTLVVSGTASETTLQGTATGGGATEIVADGGTETAAVVTSGTLSATSGGTVTDATILSGGRITLASGAVAGTVSAGQGATVTISAAQVETLMLSGDSTATITSAAVPLSSFSDAELTLGYGTSANGLTVGSGATLQMNGGTAVGTTVSGTSAVERLLAAPLSGGPADTGFDILSSGSQTVYFGVSVASGTVDDGGTQYLMSTASADHVIIASGGGQFLSSGAVATDDLVEAGASVVDNGTLIFDGQSTIQGQISGSGTIGQTGDYDTLRFASGALAAFSGTIDMAGGAVVVADGQEAANITFDFTASGAGTLTLGDTLPSSVTVSGFASGDRIVLSGVTSGATLEVSSGSQILLESGGAVIETIHLNSGLDYSAAGLTLTEQADGETAVLTIGGTASNYVDTVVTSQTVSAIVSSGEGAVISAGTTAIGTTVDSGGRLYVDGTGIQGIVSSGGSETVRSGGATSQTTVRAGGETIVEAGGTADGTTVDGGTQDVSGGTVTDAVILGGFGDTLYDPTSPGVQMIGSGGVASGTLVEVGSATNYTLLDSPLYSDVSQDVAAGGTVIDTTLTGGRYAWQYHFTLQWSYGTATETVESGGTAVHTTVNVGAVMVVETGGAASNVVLDGGSLTLAGGALYSGVLTFAPITATSSSPDPTGSALVLTTSQISGMTIAGFDVIGTTTTVGYGYVGSTTINTINSIVITDLTFAGTSGEVDTAMIGADDLLTVTEGNETVTLQLSGTFGSDFYFQAAPGGGTEITYGVPCYCPGTLIATPEGQRPIEDLVVGDLILTASGGARPIRWIGRRSYDGRFARGNPDIMPVIFRPGSLGSDASGETVPRRRLVVSPLHAMALDGCLVPARLLLNGTSIVQMQQTDRVDYIHIELDTHDILLAEGAASETFVDDGSRGMFHNAGEFDALYPDALPAESSGRSGLFCLPRIEDGPALEALRTRLAGQGKALAERWGIRGFIDVISARTIEGWARCDAFPDEPRTLSVRCDNIETGRVTADRFRADLTENGRFSGKSGFVLRLDQPVSGALITVTDLETGTPLLRAVQDGCRADAA
ncbi:Hint domain-containing protein [Acetobacter oeni]|uniref:Hedgehog/Intein (Hint) domain-containing protein n=1 Tax=Acetobacter oeni TaxID=304077 RepID=A0A511XIE0_9PROT|nr:Hint domain-containing protein [Acetobacter oeni]MBB3881441.1 autotransporter passenger strand-loop-strand repeat protein [Acetobacter oeni]NHO18306.1 hypothetical protein [Acetobacter oeni]GBR10982.1 hypothetical protein AA21952_3229 [Acetobacter oeni LMG 21952]GEN62718.1 hypothetical protein AOE01nite_09420 [Acetobacter oeni]